MLILVFPVCCTQQVVNKYFQNEERARPVSALKIFAFYILKKMQMNNELDKKKIRSHRKQESKEAYL